MTEFPEGFRIDRSEWDTDDEYTEFSDYELPSYVGSTTFQKVPAVTDDEIGPSGAQVAIIGAPLDDGVSEPPGRQVRPARDPAGHLSLRRPVLDPARDLGARPRPRRRRRDAPVVPARFVRGLRVIHEKVWRAAKTGAIPIVLGGDHSITYPSAAAVARANTPKSVGIVHFDAHADTGSAADVWGSLVSHGAPMRRLIEEGWVAGRNFVQVGLRGYWPERAAFDWMNEQGMRWHRMVEIEERGAKP